jgi:hypothetical protein
MVHPKQRGITLIGWIFLLVPLAIVLYASIRLAPIYLNYLSVKKTVDQVSEELKGNAGLNNKSIREALAKRMDVEGITFPTVSEMIVKRDDNVWVIQAKYEDVVPLFSNLSLLVQFDEARRIQ